LTLTLPSVGQTGVDTGTNSCVLYLCGTQAEAATDQDMVHPKCSWQSCSFWTCSFWTQVM